MPGGVFLPGGEHLCQFGPELGFQSDIWNQTAGTLALQGALSGAQVWT